MKVGDDVVFKHNCSGIRQGGYVMFERQLELVLSDPIKRHIEYHLNEIRRILEEM
jgi:hypothetical protein